MHIDFLIDLKNERYLDNTFERFCEWFLATHLPKWPMRLLPEDAEEWEVEPRIRFVVQEIEYEKFGCPDCMNEVSTTQPESVLPCDCGTDQPWEVVVETGYLIRDTDYAGFEYTDRKGEFDVLVDGVKISCWDSEGRAETEAHELNCDGDGDSLDQFLSAQWVYLPDDAIGTSELITNNFLIGQLRGRRVAVRTGGKWTSNVPLMIEVLERQGAWVPTEKGLVQISTKWETAAEEIAAAIREACGSNEDGG